MNISYSILTHNETDTLEDLLEFLGSNKKQHDEVVVLDDYSNDKTLGILTEYKEKYGIIWEQRALDKNFGEQKTAVKKAQELLMELYSTGNLARNSVDFNSIDITT